MWERWKRGWCRDVCALAGGGEVVSEVRHTESSTNWADHQC